MVTYGYDRYCKETLKTCNSDDRECRLCVYSGDEDCREHAMVDALSYINRLEKEIESMEKDEKDNAKKAVKDTLLALSNLNVQYEEAIIPLKCHPEFRKLEHTYGVNVDK